MSHVAFSGHTASLSPVWGRHLGSPSALGAGLWTGKGLASSALWLFPAVAQGDPTGHSVLGRPLGLHRRAVLLLRADLNTGRSHCVTGPLEATCFPVFTGVGGPSAKPPPTEQDTFFPWRSHGAICFQFFLRERNVALVFTNGCQLSLVLTLSSLHKDDLSQASCKGDLALRCRCAAG